MISLIQKFDICILTFINNNMHYPIMDKAMVIVTSLGNMGIIWIIISIILIVNKKYRNIGIMVLGALLLSTILGEVCLKPLVHRLRPFSDNSSVKLLIARPISFSFPSGHTTSSFAAAGILAKYFKNYAPYIFSLAALIAFSRLYLYVHYPTDVLAGVILGLVCSKIIIYIFSKIQSLKSFSK